MNFGNFCITDTLRRYRKDRSGHFAVWFALLGLPLLASASYVIDYNRALDTKADLKGALDAAALAAVSKQNISESERAIYAQDYFNENFAKANEFKLSIDNRSAKKVQLSATGRSPVTIAAALGIKDIVVSEDSSAIVTSENVVCVMTLNPDGRESFSVYSGARFRSPTCAVQVNSNHPEAAYVSSDSSAVAKDFCIVGGGSGSFSPYINTECSPLQDPYINKVAPAAGPCVSLLGANVSVKGPTMTIGNNVVMTPGTYCQNVRVSGKNVRMLPGTYIMKDTEIWMRNGSTLDAESATIVLEGKFARIYVEQGSVFNLSAPKTGPLAGLAIFQNRAVSLNDSNKLPNGSSSISGGSKMSIVGTVYLPTQTIEVYGDSGYDNTSPATAYIGYNVSLGKGANLAVKVDHSTAGLPPILPRSDEGARLVQ
ncbi:MAG: hypothetical protein HKN36_11555 [Hellea sp.]|nr:hypothetical protein [Hellea sp.]